MVQDGRGSALVWAARRSGVVWGGLFALGIGFGVLVVGHGLPWWLAPVISASMFAGSVEFILVGMLAAGAPVAAVATTTFLVNSRHLFYGLTFPLEVVRGRLGRAYSVFALCDEAYAITASTAAKERTSARVLWTQLGLHLSWTFGALVGALVGSTALSDLRGLDVILTALFVVLTVDAYRDRPDPLTLALAVLAGVAAHLVVPGSMVLAAMSGFAACLVVRHVLGRHRDRAAAAPATRTVSVREESRA
jgi:4-azaleucine resistance transporter AzlC